MLCVSEAEDSDCSTTHRVVHILTWRITLAGRARPSDSSGELIALSQDSKRIRGCGSERGVTGKVRTLCMAIERCECRAMLGEPSNVPDRCLSNGS